MDSFDFVVIGAGASGEAAASCAAIRGKSVALIEKDLVGDTVGVATEEGRFLVPDGRLRVAEDAFPTTSRALWWVIARASRQLGPKTSARAS